MATLNTNSLKVSNQQKKLRFTTNPSIKPSKNPSNLTPLLSKEFNRVILGLRKTQKETFAHCKGLFLSFDKKLSELKPSIDSIASQIVVIRADNTSHRNDFSALNERIHIIKSDASKSPTSINNSISQLLQELSERKKCSHNVNVIVHGLIKSFAVLSAGHIADDIQYLSDSVLQLSMSLPPNMKMIRSGHTNGKNPRQLKIIFPSKAISLQIIRDLVANTRSRSAVNSPLSVSIIRDRTLMGKQQIRQVYVDLE